MSQAIDAAWENRTVPGRFKVEGKTAVFFSGFATPSEHRREALDKAVGESIHSGELAERHTVEDTNTVTLSQTPGGQELNRIEQWIKSDLFSPDERRKLEQEIKPLWEDASKQFAMWAREQSSSIGYIENADQEKIYHQTEHAILQVDLHHIHLTDDPTCTRDIVPPNKKNMDGTLFERGS